MGARSRRQIVSLRYEMSVVDEIDTLGRFSISPPIIRTSPHGDTGLNPF